MRLRGQIVRRAALMLIALSVLSAAPLLRAQDLVDNALVWLPPGTIALEYSRLSALRGLPQYSSLRTHYLGRNLRILQQSLSKLGIQESDIDEMVLGWQSLSQKKWMRYEGLASGRFDAAQLDRSATASGLKAQKVDGHNAYCIPSDPNSTCVVVLSDSLGIFAPMPMLEVMLKARDDPPASPANPELERIAQSARSSAPIWGVALGGGVSNWFKAWMPGEKNLQMDWAAAFKDVRALSYTVQARDEVHLNIKLDCDSTRAASSVRQLLEGLKLVQQLAWHTENPSQPNPFQDIEVASADRQVSFRLTADYTALESVGPLGKP